ncbi:hypothetical protein DS742_05295 [Lacrimispora amygdalina]|uniref:SEC-C domain-containing protein n=1 Tax=Lacrimispora amygdalina TaxID=253257 RepID=A0A3E2NFW1_9FIRM|nr:SEC-C domain-containing protein [Clostridium indicum]RFZ79877.1 hypothetical protein DS742_05295 [Clostridium indicum]
MKLELDLNEMTNFISKYGVDPYELCPCGSGKKYKWCCKTKIIKIKNGSELKALYHNLKNQTWNRRKWKTQICHWAGCTEETQHCHSIQNNRFLNQICGVNKEVYHFIPMGTMENEKIELKEETISLASTFNGFCNSHDKDLFAIVERNNEITFSLEQQYVLVYRNLFYMLCKIEITQQIVISMSLRGTPNYYSKKFQPRTLDEAKTAMDLILELRKKQVTYQEYLELIKDIESNYDTSTHTWIIHNPTLILSKVRTLSVTNANFCFQTVREYLSEIEVEKKYTNPVLDNFEDKRYNYISTIILPNVEMSQITIFFAISKKHTTESPLKFIEYINNCTDKELVNILNNIIIDAYEELYLSKSKLYDVFPPEQQRVIKEILTQQTYNGDAPFLLDDILLNPKFNFISIPH